MRLGDASEHVRLAASISYQVGDVVHMRARSSSRCSAATLPYTRRSPGEAHRVRPEYDSNASASAFGFAGMVQQRLIAWEELSQGGQFRMVDPRGFEPLTF